jgi:hypothetical protein
VLQEDSVHHIRLANCCGHDRHIQQTQRQRVGPSLPAITGSSRKLAVGGLECSASAAVHLGCTTASSAYASWLQHSEQAAAAAAQASCR